MFLFNLNVRCEWHYLLLTCSEPFDCSQNNFITTVYLSTSRNAAVLSFVIWIPDTMWLVQRFTFLICVWQYVYVLEDDFSGESDSSGKLLSHTFVACFRRNYGSFISTYKLGQSNGVYVLSVVIKYTQKSICD